MSQQIYLTNQIEAQLINYYDGRQDTNLVRAGTGSYVQGSGSNHYVTTVPLASSSDVAYQLSQLKAEIDALKSQVSLLQAQLHLAHKKPLDNLCIERLIDIAYQDQQKANAAGQQISIWDGIESHVVRATERAHGIT